MLSFVPIMEAAKSGQIAGIRKDAGGRMYI